AGWGIAMVVAVSAALIGAGRRHDAAGPAFQRRVCWTVSGELGRQIRGAPGRLAGHPVACTASRMTRVTTFAREMRDRGPALTSVMGAPARWAMNVSSAGGMTRPPVPITAQDGMVFQAG